MKACCFGRGNDEEITVRLQEVGRKREKASRLRERNDGGRRNDSIRCFLVLDLLRDLSGVA